MNSNKGTLSFVLESAALKKTHTYTVHDPRSHGVG